MPKFRKDALSKYIRTECQRQLKLNLSPDNNQYKLERTVQNMPDPQPPRPGLDTLRKEGEEWEAQVIDYLTQTFNQVTGQAVIIGDSSQHNSGQTRYRKIQLIKYLSNVQPNSFLIEAEYNVSQSFKDALNIAGYDSTFNLDYAEVRPDIIEILPSNTYEEYVTPNGEIQSLPENDKRLQVRIIDIKLTAEPSPSYFAEVTYYTMVLAGWLIDNNLDDQFVVVSNGAIWSGSYDGSNLVAVHNELNSKRITPTYKQLREAMQEDLEEVPFGVFVPRIKRFFQNTLSDILAEANWQALDWHVDNRCKGCDNLGYEWVNKKGNPTWHPDHCMPTAQKLDHLSRVAFVSKGSRSALESQGITTVQSLAQLPSSHSSFDGHQNLRATRTVIGGRASSLQNQQSFIPANSGTSAIIPKWTDLHIYLTVDFDIGSAITFAFGLQAFWLEPRPFGSTNQNPRTQKTWNTPKNFIIDRKNLQDEQRELLNFLERINTILMDAQNLDSNTTIQFYIWDSIQYEHLTRIFSRHLQAILANQNICNLAWLFPPEQLLPNSNLVTKRSPITIVKEVVKSVVATPVPHYYSLLQVARYYNWNNKVINLSVPSLFEDILSDLIPSERAHDIWSRSRKPYWRDQMDTLGETVEKRLNALKIIVDKLENDLQTQLDQTAPKVNIIPPPRQNRLSWDSQLWYMFAKLDAALSELEVHQIRAMPPHEREARFYSARLTRKLTGQQEQQVLQELRLQPRANRRVYEIQPDSRHIKVRDGDFNFALAPENNQGFLDTKVWNGLQNTPLAQILQNFDRQALMEDITGVTVVKLDRDNCWIVVDQNNRWSNRISLNDLEIHGIANLSSDVILDRTYSDFFTKKLYSKSPPVGGVLHAIGNPQIARDNALVRQATGMTCGRNARTTRHTPAADLLWDAVNMHKQTVTRNLAPVRTTLEKNGLNLNQTQWLAWEQALSRRLQLIWGPPGTGKSRTARAIVVGAALEASQRQQNQKIRILVSASTYTAIDNILLDIYDDICRLLLSNIVEVYRLRSYLQPDPTDTRALHIDAPLNKRNPSQQIQGIRQRLEQKTGITIVGATSEQVYNLLTVNDSPAQAEFFDLILIDEASQMDVAHAILAFCSLADGGSVVLAGDPLQLAPIHQAEPPKDLEDMVGSIYAFCRDFQLVPDVMLDENYRSNETLVGFARNYAGYRQSLSSYSPDLRLNLLNPTPTQQPSNWSHNLYWTSEWAEFLNPEYPATCFVYPDGSSSQWNPFEADTVVALVSLLHDQMANQLLDENDPATGQIKLLTQKPYTLTEFWQKAVGVVTPHRAQQGLIVSQLQQIFANPNVSPNDIRDAVDTVERFQGQQRDVIIASFAMGDPDAIADEDEFLMSLNRFNVMASRARAKLILLLSQEVVDHLSSDLATLRESRLLKLYVDSFCDQSRSMTLGYLDGNAVKQVKGSFRWR
ncbi:AAA domain-containing protein [Cyanobacterium sp. IPPAS B-1200]|uniref:bifunctional RecB family nuclease/DEAD/DEAH box helicase n=1 Tax=Cyanobacterium sp. IPPAS B-1200 TaxID=1562720 RepID=UPI0008524D78|nr:AAA domain-containing protein [Cyanobacterium sp. IPPAS B-1200]OEJ79587.1 hypothetical protein A5482_09970 [Cyanobacterium sp. IPPAS B-1200]